MAKIAALITPQTKGGGKRFAVTAEVLAIVKLIQDLAPTGIALVKSLLDRMTGKTDEEIAALAHSINQQTQAEIAAAESELPK